VIANLTSAGSMIIFGEYHSYLWILLVGASNLGKPMLKLLPMLFTFDVGLERHCIQIFCCHG
jgi:hypothetical protein